MREVVIQTLTRDAFVTLAPADRFELIFPTNE